MNIEIIWFVIIAISIPLAGFIGFSVQVRSMKKLRLENDKLTLENLALRAAQQDATKSSVTPINTARQGMQGVDTQGVDDISPSEESIEEDVEDLLSDIDWRDKLIQIGTLFLLCYFLYDIYRFGTWLYSLI
ncbi:hypothetical protein EKG38_12985 [Shewanella canadensis]|uniref:Uncharacterized protein n=1 Tax=Shewanella canadensis TaxID=271096 RepID=A0A3S0J5M8_9GAMM|nr:hypothetical protein [Shewanella canadensis]RTR38431.1 hypothetical protein EKG38_12985 [Shewanella canadensis]